MNTRRAGSVCIVAVSGLALALGLAQIVAPRWVRAVGLDVWNFAEARDEMQRLMAHAAELQAVGEQQVRHLGYMDSVALRLAAGDMTLAEATDEMEPILRAHPHYEKMWEVYYPGLTFRQAVARNAIMTVAGPLGHNRDRDTLARLEREYTALRK
jgi:hypothetical protein